MKRILACLLVLEGVAAAQGYGPPPPPPPTAVYGYPSPGAHIHDGLYLHFGLGLGGSQATASADSGPDVKVSGGSGFFTFAVGGSLSDSVVLFGELMGQSVVGPTISVGGTSITTSNDTSASIAGIGGGLAYYFMPSNFFISGAIDAFQLSARDNGNDEAHTDAGVGLHLSVGKEWWVSDGWGLGVAVELFGGRIKDNSQGDPTWTAGSIGIVFSATYN